MDDPYHEFENTKPDSTPLYKTWDFWLELLIALLSGILFTVGYMGAHYMTSIMEQMNSNTHIMRHNTFVMCKTMSSLSTIDNYTCVP